MTIHMDKENIITSYYDAFSYHEKKVGEGAAYFLEGTVSKSESVNLKSKNFDLIHSLNNRVKLKGFDIPFTFDKNDKMTDQKFSSLFSMFQKDMGFEERPYAVYRHNDTENLHYHVVIGNVSFDGVPNPELRKRYRTKATKLSRKYEEKFNLRVLKKVGQSEFKAFSLKELNAEKYSFQKSLLAQDNNNISLSPDEINYLSVNRTNEEISSKDILQNNLNFLVKKDLIIKSKKQRLIETLDLINKKEQNLISFIKECQNHDLYCRVVKRPKLHLVYGIKKDDGNYLHIKDSKLPKRFSYSHIINPNIEAAQSFSVDKQKQYLKNIIKRVSLKSQSFDEFKNILSERYNIEIVLNSNKVAISGISFRSLNSKENILFKGSELGYSYNKLDKIFSNNPNSFKKDTIDDSKDKPRTNVKPQKNNPISSLTESNLDNNISSVLGMENFHDEDEEEKRKKKRKKGKGL